MTFDPLNLDNRASVNRTVLASHRAIERSVRGKQGWDLLSAQALRQQIRARADLLGLEPNALDSEDPILLLEDGLTLEEAAGTHARLLAARFGRFLAYLLMSLTKFGSGWPQPDTPYARHWTTVRNVWLGGGIMRGRLGGRMQAMCRVTLDKQGFRGLTVSVAPDPHLLPLIGAARSVPEPAAAALVYDFGGTGVKRGLARYGDDGTLVALDVGPPVPTGGLPDAIAGTPDPATAQRLADFITGLIADDWLNAVAVGEAPATHIVTSIACYLRDGQPLAYDAGYASLRLLSDNAARYLSEAVSARVGSEVHVMLSHDGTTAARVFAGQPRTAVIMLGTWLGAGFAPEDASGLRPLAPDFRVASNK